MENPPKEDQNEILVSLKPGSSEDKSFGSILGAFIGDSAGSYLEFI